MALFNKKEDSVEYKKRITSENSLSDHDKTTIESAAQQQCIMQGGNAVSFEAGLKDEYSKFSKTITESEEEQEKLKEGIKQEKITKESEKDTLVKQKDQLENKVLADITENIKKCEEAISDSPNNPLKYGISTAPAPSTKTLFYIGCIILAAVGVFLAIFYMSASYSAFYKVWEDESALGLTAKIFDSNAFVKSWAIGVPAGLFVSFTVFIFLGMGVLLHVFQKETGRMKWVKLTTIVIITFLFDCLIAYFIEDNVYQINKTLGSPDFDLAIALQTMGFWIIIFFGFVTYIIWGLVFDFTMDKWEQFSPLLVFQKSKEKEIKILKLEKKEISSKISDLEIEISNYEGKIYVISEKLKVSIIPINRFENIHSAYVKGWIFGIAGCAISEEIKEKRRSDCDEAAKAFISKLNKEE